MAGNLLAGTANVTVDGQTFPMVGEALYNASSVKRETVTGMDGVHGFKETPMAPYMECTLRDAGGKTVADFNAQTNVTVVFQLANGKVVVGRNMWTADSQEVNVDEASFKVRWEGFSVVEAPAS